MKSFLKKNIDTVLLGLILILAFILRIYQLSSIPFTHDEFSAIFRTNFNSFRDLIDYGIKVDGHPPLIQVFLFYWIKIYGISEVWIKFPFILCGVGAVYFSYKIAKEWFNSTTGMIVSLLIAILEYPVLYSQIARPYISGLFLVLLFVYFWNKVLFHPEKKRWWNVTGYAIFGALASYDHHFALLQVAIIGLTGLIFINRKVLVSFLTSNILLIILYLPNLTIFFEQLHLKGIEGWLAKPDNNFIIEYFYYIINFSSILGFVLGIILLGGIFVKSSNERLKYRFTIISIIWFIVPFLIGFYYSIYINAVLQYSVLIFAFPFLLLSVFGLIRNTSLLYKVISIFIISSFGIYSLVFERNHYQIFYQSPYEKIIENSIIDAETLTSEKCLNVFSLSLNDTISTPSRACRYFITKFKLDDKLTYLSIDSTSDYKRLVEALKSFHGNFVYYGYLSNANPEIYPLIQHYFPYVFRKYNFSGGDAVIFSKTKNENPYNYLSNSTMSFENNVDSWNDFNKNFLNDSISTDGKYSYLFDSLSEWGPSYTDTLFKIAQKTDYIDVSIDVFPLGNFSDAFIVSTLDDDTVNIDWRSTSFSIFGLKKSSWSTITHSIKLPDINKKAINPVLKVYLWNKEKQNFLIDNFSIHVRKGNPILYWQVTKEVKSR